MGRGPAKRLSDLTRCLIPPRKVRTVLLADHLGALPGLSMHNVGVQSSADVQPATVTLGFCPGDGPHVFDDGNFELAAKSASGEFDVQPPKRTGSDPMCKRLSDARCTERANFIGAFEGEEVTNTPLDKSEGQTPVDSQR